MERKKPNRTRKILNFTLAPEVEKRLREISEKTGISMSKLIDTMILEYSENHKEELRQKGVEF